MIQAKDAHHSAKGATVGPAVTERASAGRPPTTRSLIHVARSRSRSTSSQAQTAPSHSDTSGEWFDQFSTPQLRRRARRTARQHCLNAVDGVLADERLEVATLAAQPRTRPRRRCLRRADSAASIPIACELRGCSRPLRSPQAVTRCSNCCFVYRPVALSWPVRYGDRRAVPGMCA